MKPLISKYFGMLALMLVLFGSTVVFAQGADKSNITIDIAYYVLNNRVPYLVITTKTKVEKKFIPVENMSVKVFMDKDSSGNMLGSIGEVKTNYKGKAVVMLPPSMKSNWDALERHSFFATSAETKKYGSADGELTISKARISIDTADDRNIKVIVTQLKNKEWIPVKGVEVKIGIKRFDSYLPVGDEPTYTTDSLGVATAEFKKNKMPGDKTGNIILVARIEENDQFGNITAEKQAPWGANYVYTTTYGERTLWSTRLRTPFWLLVLAYSIFLSVWGTLIYLIVLLLKIRKLGKLDADQV